MQIRNDRSVKFSGTPVVPIGGSAQITVTVSPSTNTTPISLVLSVTSGTGQATLLRGQSTISITNTSIVTLLGVSPSSTPNNVQLAAKTNVTLATTSFTVAVTNGAIPANYRQVQDHLLRPALNSLRDVEATLLPNALKASSTYAIDVV
jgi:hypothetical protein